MKQHPLCTDCENPVTPLDLPLPVSVKQEWAAIETRRRFLGRSGKVLGWAALAGLFGDRGLWKSAQAANVRTPAAEGHTEPGLHGQAVARRDGPGRRRNDLAPVSTGEARCVLEHLIRADEIQRLEAFEDYEDDAPLRHASTLRQPRRWRQRRLPHGLRHPGVAAPTVVAAVLAARRLVRPRAPPYAAAAGRARGAAARAGRTGRTRPSVGSPTG